MDENQTVNQSPEYVADFSWDFAGSKGAVHMDGDVDSLRTLTIDASGAIPENAMSVRVEFKGNLFLQLAACMAKSLDAMGPAFAKSFALGMRDVLAKTEDVPNKADITDKPSDAPAPEPQDTTSSDDAAPQDDITTYDGPTPSAQEAESEED